MAMTNFIPTIWDETIHREKVAKDVFAENCNRKYEGTLAEKGDSVKILGVKAPTIRTLDKKDRNGNISDAEEVVEDSITMHVNQIAYYNYGVNDFDKREAIDGVMDAVKKSTAEQLSNTTDKYIANLAKDKLAVKSASTVVDESNVLKFIDGGIQRLYEKNVSDNTTITLTVSPTRMSLNKIKSSLCNVALEINEPATLTGSNTALGVILPVLPTVKIISFILVITSSGGNL